MTTGLEGHSDLEVPVSVSDVRLEKAFRIEQRIREEVQERYNGMSASARAAITHRITHLYGSLGVAEMIRDLEAAQGEVLDYLRSYLR